MFPNGSKPTHSVQMEGGVEHGFTCLTIERNTTAF